MADRDEWIAQLFEQQNKRLTRIAYRLTGSMEQAKDLVQDTFVFALVRYEELVNHPCIVGWLTKTLRNLVVNENRRIARHPEIPLGDIDEPSAPHPPTSLEEIFPRHFPEADRQILIWRYEYELSYREIAERLGVSEGACRMRMYRLLRKCEVYFGGFGRTAAATPDK